MMEVPSLFVVGDLSTARARDGARRGRREAGSLNAFVAEVLERQQTWQRRVPRHVAEDLLQNALVRLIEHADDVAPGARAAWLRTALLHEKLHLAREETSHRSREPEVAAHFQEVGSPFAAPDAETARREALAAASWLLSQVHPERRAVAGWCMWKVLADGEQGLDEIAEGLGIERGTLGSQWARAKRDMEAALRRERARRRGTSRLSALFAFLAAACMWIVRRGASAAEVVERAAGSAWRGREEARRSERAGAAQAGAARDAASGRRAVVALASLLLPVVLIGHGPRVERVEPAAVLPVRGAGIAAGAGSDASIARVLPSAAPSGPSRAVVAVETSARPATITSRATRATAPDGTRVAAGRAPLARPAPNAKTKDDATAVRSDARLEAARAHLVSVHRALHGQGDRDGAKRMLELYEMTFPEDPFPSKHAELSAALNAP